MSQIDWFFMRMSPYEYIHCKNAGGDAQDIPDDLGHPGTKAMGNKNSAFETKLKAKADFFIKILKLEAVTYENI